jgi:hypothetical protein
MTAFRPSRLAGDGVFPTTLVTMSSQHDEIKRECGPDFKSELDELVFS